jgi:hypothetical protein
MHRDAEFAIRAAWPIWYAASGAASIITTVAEHKPLRFTFAPLKNTIPRHPHPCREKKFRNSRKEFRISADHMQPSPYGE